MLRVVQVVALLAIILTTLGAGIKDNNNNNNITNNNNNDHIPMRPMTTHLADDYTTVADDDDDDATTTTTITTTTNNNNNNTNLTLGSLAIFVRRAFDDAEATIQSIVQNFGAHVPQIANGVTQLLDEILYEMDQIIDSVNMDLLRASDAILYELLRHTRRQLDQMIDEFEALGARTDKQLKHVIHYLNDTLIEQSENIDAWAAHLKAGLRNVNDTRLYREGCRMVDKLIEDGTAELRSCCNIAVMPMRSLCRDARDLLTAALRTLADAFERMQACLKDKRSYHEYMRPCISLVYGGMHAMIARIRTMASDLEKLLHAKITVSRFCITVVSVQMGHRQNAIEQAMDVQWNRDGGQGEHGGRTMYDYL